MRTCRLCCNLQGIYNTGQYGGYEGSPTFHPCRRYLDAGHTPTRLARPTLPRYAALQNYKRHSVCLRADQPRFLCTSRLPLSSTPSRSPSSILSSSLSFPCLPVCGPLEFAIFSFFSHAPAPPKTQSAHLATLTMLDPDSYWVFPCPKFLP